MSIFNFKETKAFLRHYIHHLPKKGRGQISEIAKAVGVSTSLVSQVISGKKTFTPEQIQKLSEHIGLIGLEADYLAFLNQKERAGSKKLSEYWNEKINEIREKSLQLSSRLKTDKTLTKEQKAIFYSSPIYSAVRLYCSVGAKGKSLDDICTRFGLSRIKASTLVNFLVETDLCVEEDGRYFLGSQKTHLEKSSPHILQHHSNWRLRSLQQYDDLTDQELMYTAPVSLSKDDFQQLREEMVGFIKTFLDRVHASPAEEIACFNLDFFWIKK